MKRKFIYTRSNPLTKGKYQAARPIKTIEDPRTANYSREEMTNNAPWEQHTYAEGEAIEITGKFKHRDKTWYQVNHPDAKKPQVINEISLLGTTMTKLKTRNKKLS